jgi:putative aldouronate transport system permease protein
MGRSTPFNLGEGMFQTLNYIVFTIIIFVCAYPFYYILLQSFSDPDQASRHIIAIYPLGFTLQNYVEVLMLKGLSLAFVISVGRTVIGTVITLFFTSILAYTLTKNELIARKMFYRITVTSMYLNAGLIPWYITMRNLGLKDSFLLYIVPSAVAVFSLILIKTYMESIPSAMEESALVDGAGYFTIFMKVMLPLSKPVMAAVAVFTATSQWNTWVDNLLLINNSNLNTLQFVLFQYLNQAEVIASQARNGGSVAITGYQLSPFSLRMTMTMVVTIPVLLLYPLIQKHFVGGIMLGAVKG